MAFPSPCRLMILFLLPESLTNFQHIHFYQLNYFSREGFRNWISHLKTSPVQRQCSNVSLTTYSSNHQLPFRHCTFQTKNPTLFPGATKPTRPVFIGRVHVEDEDSWDLPDKVFYWKDNNQHPNFDLNVDTGEIHMIDMTSGGRYTLHFNVIDQKRREEVESLVTVTVKEIPEEAVYSSGSIRIAGRCILWSCLPFISNALCSYYYSLF